MEQYQTEKGRRQDLELALTEVNPYLGAIGREILPANEKAMKSGTYYYQTLQADAVAQTGRSSTAAPTRVTITENSSTWSASERIKGYQLPRDSVKTQFGNIERADKFGSKAALRSVMRSHELAVAGELLGNGSIQTRNILGDFVKQAKKALEAIKRYPGEKALVASHTVFNRIMEFDSVTSHFSDSSAQVDGASAEDIIARKPEALKMLLAAIVGVDRILIGDDDLWYDSNASYQQKAAVLALPRKDEFSELEEAVFGKTFLYMPDGAEYPFYIESFYLNNNKTNVWDCSMWDSLEVLNTGAACILEGIDEGNATTTTTTTTT